MRIDLNADVGESYGAWQMGRDDELVPLVSSVNVACGAHAGDPTVLARTVALAKLHGAVLGAHPGYPDRDAFGRRELPMSAEELRASLLYQLGGLAAIARAAGLRLRHVKAHGALYNRAARDESIAATLADAVRAFDGGLVLVGLAGSVMLEAGRAAGLSVAAEGFADRAYEPDGSLRSRSLPGALIESPEAAAEQAVAIVTLGQAVAHDGSIVQLQADTICIHGDTPGAPAYARAIRTALSEAGVRIAPLGRG